MRKWENKMKQREQEDTEDVGLIEKWEKSKHKEKRVYKNMK